MVPWSYYRIQIKERGHLSNNWHIIKFLGTCRKMGRFYTDNSVWNTAQQSIRPETTCRRWSKFGRTGTVSGFSWTLTRLVPESARVFKPMMTSLVSITQVWHGVSGERCGLHRTWGALVTCDEVRRNEMQVNQHSGHYHRSITLKILRNTVSQYSLSPAEWIHCS